MEDTWVHRRVLLFEAMHFLRAATPASKASTPVRQRIRYTRAEVPLLPPDIANQLQFAMSKQARQPQVPGNQVHAAVACQMEAGAAPRAADVPLPWRLIAPRPRRHADIPFPPDAA